MSHERARTGNRVGRSHYSRKSGLVGGLRIQIRVVSPYKEPPHSAPGGGRLCRPPPWGPRLAYRSALVIPCTLVNVVQAQIVSVQQITMKNAVLRFRRFSVIAPSIWAKCAEIAPAL